MIRKIVHIDEEKCNGCGACAEACHEGAIAIINGKAKLLRDDYCDGLGACLPHCPADAISFIEREALEFDEDAVFEAKKKKIQELLSGEKLHTGCPGEAMKNLSHNNSVSTTLLEKDFPSQLSQWPIQIKLVFYRAPYFDGCDLLVAADCTAYAYGNFHNKFIKNRITLIGCPKLDMIDYTEKLSAIVRENNIKSLTVVKMEVPCCNGIEYACKEAIKSSGKNIPFESFTISTDGKIL